MAVLDGIKGLFRRKDKGFNPLNTSWIMEKMNLPEGSDEKQLKPLPLIGHLPSRVQMGLLLMVMIFAAVLFLLTAFFSFQSSGSNAEKRAIATEMEMLSQRLSRGMTQAMLGDRVGFEVLEDAYKRFDADLVRLEKTTGLLAGKDMKRELGEIREIWDGTFRPGPGKLSIQSLLDQKSVLTSLGNLLSQVNTNDAMLSMQVREFAQLAATRSAPKEQAAAAQLSLMATQMSRYANALLAGESYNPEWVPQLSSNVSLFNKVTTAFKEGNAELGIAAASDPDLARVLTRIIENSKPYGELSNTVQKNNTALVAARLSSLAILRDAESLLTGASALADEYELGTKGTISNIIEVVFAAIALGALYLLVRVFNQESVRRRLNSEAENRRNQDAILRLLNDMADLADGDLTVRAAVTEDVTGAIADSINYTIEELRTLITEINRATGQVTRVTGQAQDISQELLTAAERQSHEIEDTNQTVSRIVHSIQGVSGSAVESSRVAHASLTAAEQGADAVNNQIKGMNEIREQIQETAKRIKRLGESSQEIGEIVELISDITEQTNVLALNAAIQAAAAGDAGRGFSVVAEEVQRLAERSGEATKQIGAIVKTIQADTHDAVAAMELSTQGVVEGAKLSDAAGAALSEIGQVSRELARLIESIAHETEDQTKLATHVNESMRAILAITEQTTSGAKSSADVVGQLTGLAADLKNSVSGFKL